MMTPIRSACGGGNFDDPSHRAVCLACSKAKWREDHPVAAEIQLLLTVVMFMAIGAFVVSGLLR